MQGEQKKTETKQKGKCLTSHETIRTFSIFKIGFVCGCQHPDLDFDIWMFQPNLTRWPVLTRIKLGLT